MQIHVPSTACEVISFNGQGQPYPLTYAKWRDLTRISTIQSRTPEKKAKNHVTLTWKLPWKSCSTTRLPFLSSNSKILKAFLKTFLTKMKPTKCSAKEKNEARKAKSKRQDACVTCKSKILLSGSEGRSVRTVNGFMVSFSSLIIARQWPVNRSTNFQTRFSAKFPGANGLT